MLRSLILAAMVLIYANGQASAQERFAFGQGATSCGSWTQARQARSPVARVSAQWVAGYLSGRNVEATGPDALIGSDFDGLMAWIDNYCQSKPLEPLVTAAAQLFQELLSRASRR
jgi:hypothetical protein